MHAASLTFTWGDTLWGDMFDCCVVAEEAPLPRMHERQRGVFVGALGDFVGNDSLRSGDCHAMFVSVMSRKRGRLMAARKNDRNAQALPLITGSMLRPSRIIVHYVRPFIIADTHGEVNNRPDQKMIMKNH